MSCLIKKANIDVKDKKVIILGTGGTSKTAYAVAKHLGAQAIYKVSRSFECEEVITYKKLYENHTEWAELVKNVMKVDFSWTVSAKKYIDIYTSLM
jgi:shikimate dehydrogenase